MKYFAVSKADGSKREITHEEAKRYLSNDYVEKVCTFDEMLSYEGNIPCMFYIIEVKAE